jgi:hypothetical protein
MPHSLNSLLIHRYKSAVMYSHQKMMAADTLLRGTVEPLPNFAAVSSISTLAKSTLPRQATPTAELLNTALRALQAFK